MNEISSKILGQMINTLEECPDTYWVKQVSDTKFEVTDQETELKFLVEVKITPIKRKD